MGKLKHIESGQVIETSQTPIFSAGVWECGDLRFTDPSRDQYEVVDVHVHPVVSPPQFKLLYTSAERVALRGNLAGQSPDPVLVDFFSLLDDPQLKEVDLNLESVQGGIEYSLNLAGRLVNPAYTPDDIERRRAAMLTGVPL